MQISIDRQKFEEGHKLFLQYMYDRSDRYGPSKVPFTTTIGFDHATIVHEELAYKYAIIEKAHNVLHIGKWDKRKAKPERIIEEVKAICTREVSGNLLEHRWGMQSSARPLISIRTLEQKRGLAKQLHNFFRGSEEFGTRFDTFAQYLKNNRLGQKWAFITYLAFVLDPNHYFSVLPTRLNVLLDFYGISYQLRKGRVSWESYSVPLQLASVLKTKLAMYGNLNTIQIQSYMWVVSAQIMKKKTPKISHTTRIIFESKDESEARAQNAAKLARIGAEGEALVEANEKEKLMKANRSDLAQLVDRVALKGDHYGYDILSYETNGRELHIEVKTTELPFEDNRFFLSENERSKAEKDDDWVLYRVYDINGLPKIKNLSNIVKNGNWKFLPLGWSVSPK